MITKRAEKVTIIESGKIWLPSSKSNYDSSIGSSVTFIAAFKVFYVSVQLCWFMCAHVFTLILCMISHVYFYQDEKQIHLCFIKVCLSLLRFSFRVRRRFGSEIEPWRWKQRMQEWIYYAKDTFLSFCLPLQHSGFFFLSGDRDVIDAQTFSLISRGGFFHKFALILVWSVQSQSCAGSYRCFLSKIQCGLPVTACKHCLFAFIKASLNCFFTLIMASLISLGLTFKVKRYHIQIQHSESSSGTSASFDMK